MLLFFVYGSILVFAQSLITGNIHDEKGEPVIRATVILYPDSLGKGAMKGYAVTDNQGGFTIKAPADTLLWIIARSMGYEDITKRYSKETDGKLQLIMESKAHRLGEVHVKGTYTGVKHTGDSIIFDINHFKTGAEENITDVLKRLPGMEVSETGKVKYAGKDVDKVLVNGRDMLDTGSGVMMNNLSADVLQGVEILKNWADGSLSDKFTDRQQTALNLKTSQALRFAGNAECGGGILNKYDAKLTAMLINDKFSFTAAASSNNLGNEVFSIEEYISSFVDLSGMMSGGTAQLQLSEEESSMLTPPQNVNRNRNSATILNYISQPSDKLNIRVGALFNNARTNAFDKSINEYFTLPLLTEVSDSTDKGYDMASANIKARWQPSKTFELQSSTFGKWADYNSRENILLFDKNTAMQAYDKDNLRKWQFRQSLQATATSGKIAAYGLLALDAGNQRDRLRTVSDSLMLPTYHCIDSYYGTEVVKENTRFSLDAETGSHLKMGTDYILSASIKYNHTEDRIDYDENVTTQELENKRKTNKYAGALKILKQRGLLRFSSSLTLSENEHSLHGTRKWLTALDGDFMLRFVFSQKNELVLTGMRETTTTEINSMSDFPMHLAYDRMQLASNMKNPFVRKDIATLHYRLFNQYHNMMLFLTGLYSHTDGGGLRNIEQKGIANYVTQTDGATSKWGSLNSTLSKGIGSLPLTIMLKASWQ